jgi:hypothetical protein
VKIAPGELIDRIGILEIMAQRHQGAGPPQDIESELTTLIAASRLAYPPSEELSALSAELKEVNASLWETKEAIRECEQTLDFGARFVHFARSLHALDERRTALKSSINKKLQFKSM